MRLRNTWVGLLGIALATTLACGGSQETSSTAAKPESPSATPVGPEGRHRDGGRRQGRGDARRRRAEERTDQDERRSGLREGEHDAAVQETYIVGSDGKSLANVFVYVKDGLGNYVFDTPTKPATDRSEELPLPSARVRHDASTSRSRSSTATRRCTTSTPCRRATREFNNGQPIQGMKMTHTFDKPEVMVPFKCDVHGWMNAYVGVMSNPYFAVTDKDGKFDLPNLPPGTYTIEAWHEKLGAQTASVTIGAKETKEITFTFKPAGATATN